MRIECKYDEMMPLEEVKKRWHPNNENSHPESQIRSLAKVIAKIGIRHPIHISKQSGKICGGHGRYLAFEHLAYKEVPIVWENFKDDLEEINYRASDNIGQYAEFNSQEYVENLKGYGLDIEDLDLEEFGVIDYVLPEVEIPGNTDEDEVPDVKESRVKRGDIWTLGNHRLMCGDSTMIDDVEKLMDGQKADMVFTDPPYGYEYKSNYQKKHKQLKNDNVILDFIPLMISFLESNSAVYLCTSHQVIEKWKQIIQDNLNYKNMIIWKKNNWSMGDLKGAYAGQHEIILFAHKGKVSLEGKRDTDIWSFDRDAPKDHPTIKPVELIGYAITKINCNRVLDLFLGSGSTLIACEKTNRACYGMEIDEHYCEVILTRWENFTGKKAQRVNINSCKE